MINNAIAAWKDNDKRIASFSIVLPGCYKGKRGFFYDGTG